MGGALPSRASHSGDGASAASRTSAPRPESAVVFFLLVSSAERTPWRAARSNRVGARSRSALSMYSSAPVFSSRKELPMMPCVAGQVPQQIEVLLALVTLGMIALASAKTPPAAQRFRVGIGLSA